MLSAQSKSGTLSRTGGEWWFRTCLWHHLFGLCRSPPGLINDWIHESGVSGTVKVIGTPAEEGGSGKVIWLEQVFNDVDLVLHWHPSDANSASPYSTTANKSTFHLQRKGCHAVSPAPW